jgi:hypothetical protein
MMSHTSTNRKIHRYAGQSTVPVQNIINVARQYRGEVSTSIIKVIRATGDTWLGETQRPHPAVSAIINKGNSNIQY